jgi:hypothetical protein
MEKLFYIFLTGGGIEQDGNTTCHPMQHCEFSEIHSILLFLGNASRGDMAV